MQGKKIPVDKHPALTAQDPLRTQIQPRTTSNRGKAPFILANQPLTAIQTSNLEHIKEKEAGEAPFQQQTASGHEHIHSSHIR